MVMNNKATSNRPAPESLQGQIAELKRERGKRVGVYPRLIDTGRLTREAAARQQMSLDAAIETLIRLAEREGGEHEGR
jgi:hypothetical protein